MPRSRPLYPPELRRKMIELALAGFVLRISPESSSPRHRRSESPEPPLFLRKQSLGLQRGFPNGN